MRAALSLFVAMLLAGCASTDHVLFVTKTSVGIDFDQKPASASIGYDRVEGYVGPRYGNGEVPPVIASIKSDGGIFSPSIKQVYATGDAAIIAAGGPSRNGARPLEGSDRRMMFFGTTTTTGIKLSFTTGLPDSFVFGFKRKEFSYIPLATRKVDDKDVDVYPSVLASIDTAANVSEDGTVRDTGLSNSQFFATGAAARRLASRPEVSGGLKAAADEAVRKQQKKNVLDAQAEDDVIDALLEEILVAFADPGTSSAQRTAIAKLASESQMDPVGDMASSNFESRLTRYSSDPRRAEVRLRLQSLRAGVRALLNS